MRRHLYFTISVLAISCACPPLTQRLAAQQSQPPTQLTIYNQDFAVARTSVPLDLHAGLNDVVTTSVTGQLEPDSVILSDPTGHRAIRIAEQNYDAGVVTQAWMLQKYEGKTIQFKVGSGTFISGRIVRAGDQPLIEVDGHLQFQLPGLPIFPPETDGLLLRPTLLWKINAEKQERYAAELDYITRGLSWEATYNLVLPEHADSNGDEPAQITGWITVKNNSGADFPQAALQFLAGDVAKLQEVRSQMMAVKNFNMVSGSAGEPNVTQKAFDDFHLYDVHQTVSLLNRETKQIQFLDAAGVVMHRSYRIDGNEPLQMPLNSTYHDVQRGSGEAAKLQVAIMEEFENSTANHLGMALPAGRLRLYRQETSGQMEFVGESMVNHTPANRTVEISTGGAFDLTAERKQTDFHIDQAGHTIDETFEVKFSNAKNQAVTVEQIEHMGRAQNWQITEKSTGFTRKDSATIDFPVKVPAGGSAVLTYTVRYTW